MTTEENSHAKILFRYYSNVLEEETVETMWAIIVDKDKGLYKLDNIPFYGPFVASGDIVFAEFDTDEEMLTYRSTVEYSGNSIVQVLLTDESKEINTIRDVFKDLGCTSEKISERYFAMEIPASVNYTLIRKKLKELVSDEVIEYAEPCLADGHRY